MTISEPTNIIDKTFDPGEIEARLYARWEASGAFRPDRLDAEPFTIVIPPPNVTGSLHIGHALDNTLQDVLIRYHRLKGRDALWVVGTDHAGIATQMVVERQLAVAGRTRAEMGRDAFLAEVWRWKEESGGEITRQLRRLGASCDWAHERFTMDEGFSAAVTKVFVELYNEKLLYRDKRLVNWDPKLGTAISDLEVEPREVQGSFTHIRYNLADGSGSLIVATTRPETMLGDTAVAVNPDDERYAHMVGKMLDHPLTGRQIPVIADDWADPEFGSGAVKITPAHDFNDWAVYERHKGIGWINILDAEARIAAAEGIPAKYVGMSREEARLAIVADLDDLGLIDLIEAKTIQMPYGDRSGVVIEPWLTDQWYVDAATLAVPAIEAVRSGATKFVPANWDKTYFNWMENIQPWCVSRQLVWGHRIPAWYGVDPDGDAERPIFVAATAADAVALADDAARGRKVIVCDSFAEADALDPDERQDAYLLVRDADVLDTWFSSALWPFGTLGWPGDEASAAISPSVTSPSVIPAQAGTQAMTGPNGGELGPGLRRDDGEETVAQNAAARVSRYYPGDVLVTGFDIIFYWVARMMMQGIHFMGEAPFRTVYLHGLVRDAKGAKMSKSKGNTVDPLALIDKYGADALRFTLTAMESQGRDIKLDEKRVEGYRNFATKLWNAARFCQSNGISGSTSATPPTATATAPVNRWIIGEVVATARALDETVAAFRFDAYAETAYQFVWSRFCDWYLELTKPLLAEGADAAIAAETRAVTGWALDQILVMLHPVMPFLTEELWHRLATRDHDLIVATWPVTDAALIDAEVGAEIDWLIRLVGDIRGARSELNVSPAIKLMLHVRDADAAITTRLERQASAIGRLARIERIDFAPPPAGGAAQVVVDNATYILPLEGIIDIATERGRLEKNAVTAEKERDALAGRLASPGFVDKAKPEAVEKARADQAARAAEAERLRAALARLG